MDALKYSEPVVVMEVHHKSVTLDGEPFVFPVVEDVLKDTGGLLSYLPD